MKTAVKVLIIISIVLEAIYFIIYLVGGIMLLSAGTEDIAAFAQYYELGDAETETALQLLHVYGIYYILEAVLALVLAAVAAACLRRVWSAKKKPGIGWSIVTLLVVNFIAGIIMLCMSDKDYNPDFVPEHDPNMSNNNTYYGTGTEYQGHYYAKSEDNNQHNQNNVPYTNPPEQNKENQNDNYGFFNQDASDSDDNNR